MLLLTFDDARLEVRAFIMLGVRLLSISNASSKDVRL